MVISDEKYYVYALLDPRKKGSYKFGEYEFEYEPFYIGKGCGSRIKAHLYPSSLSKKNFKSNKIKSIINSGNEVISIKLYDNLNEKESLLLEEMLIKEIGRINTGEGCLTNLTDGNDGISNCIIEKTRKPVYKICPETLKVLNCYDSMTLASEENNLEISNISACCLGKRGHVMSGGYYWSFNSKPKRKNNCKKPVDLLNDNFGVVKTFESASKAAEELKLKGNHILRCCRGELLKVKGYKFEYNDPDLKEKFKRSPNKIKTNKKVIQIIEGKEIIHNSLKECAEYNGISDSMVNMILRGERGNSYNIFYHDKEERDKYKKFERNTKRFKPVIQLTLEGEFIKEWESISSTKIDFCRRLVSFCCHGDRNSHKGFKWVFKSDYENKNKEKI